MHLLKQMHGREPFGVLAPAFAAYPVFAPGSRPVRLAP